MKNNIVFYIRALFHESIMPANIKTNKPDIIKLVELFNRYSSITAQEYRKQIHEIQLSCIKNISDKIIYNRAQQNTEKKYNYSFSILQRDTLEALKTIKEEDFIIPLDDDDWLSPEIKHLNLMERSFNGWRCSEFMHKWFPKNVRVYNYPAIPVLPKILETELEITQSRSWLSNCQCIPGFVIKRLLEEQQIDVLQQILQRHSAVRSIIREKPIVDWNVDEHFFDESLAVYVRHAANITLFYTLANAEQEHTFTKEIYDKTVAQYKYADYDNIINFSENLKWCVPYLQKLKQLNSLL